MKKFLGPNEKKFTDKSIKIAKMSFEKWRLIFEIFTLFWRISFFRHGDHQKTSNFFSETTFDPIDFFNLKYSTSIKNNLSDISYENIITEFKVNNFVTTFDYVNENDINDENSYLTNTVKFIFDNSNNLSFSTRENKTADLTEYYNFMYQYKNDCLAASIEYNKNYYEDRDIKPEENIFLKLSIIPFGEVASTPNLKE